MSVMYSTEVIVCIEQHFHPEVLNKYLHGAESVLRSNTSSTSQEIHRSRIV